MRIRRQVQPNQITYESELGRILASSLVDALQRRSTRDVAVVLGSAAELQMFPDEALFEWSREVVESDEVYICRGVYWAVRHRCSRTAKTNRRFGMSANTRPLSRQYFAFNWREV